ncbi:MAG: ABC transporter permease [Terriglobales bacterium]
MTVWRELRQAARSLGRAPAFTAVALATLALAIGASVAIFTVVNAVLLAPLPYRQPGRLYVIHEDAAMAAKLQMPWIPDNPQQFHAWRQRARAFAGMAIAQGGRMDLTQPDQPPAQLDAGRVSANFLPLLGTRLELGRNFRPAEDVPNGPPVVILTHQLWASRFHADPAIVGKIVTLNNHPHTVVGVLAPGFRWPFRGIFISGRPSLLAPIGVTYHAPSADSFAGDYNYQVIARLRPGATAAPAAAELDAIENQLTRRYAPNAHIWTILTPVQAALAGAARQGLWLLLAAVLAVLLIGCVNLANLALARATGRIREMGLRAALGAGRGGLLRAQFAESLLLAIVGGAAGLLLAWWGEAALLAWVPAGWAPAGGVPWDWRVAAFAAGITIASAVIFGLAPAWHASRADPQLALASGGRSLSESRSARHRREALVAAEVALGAVLLIAAGLFLRSLWSLTGRPTGIQPEHLLTVKLVLPRASYQQDAAVRRFYAQALAQLRAAPGVSRAALISSLPLTGDTWIDGIERPGQHPAPGQQPLAQVRFVSPGIFSTLGIQILRGRGFAAADRTASPNEAVISRHMARALWPGRSPVGQTFSDGNAQLRVVGVAANVLERPTERPANVVYQPYWTFPWGVTVVAVRSRLALATLAPEVQRAIWKVDPTVPVQNFKTMGQVAAAALGPERFEANLLALFAAAALLLAGLGVYGVVAYSVGQRTQEIGIRAALGARPGILAGAVLRQALAPVVVGLVAGLVAALAAGRLVASLLYGVAPSDPATLGAVAAALLAAGTLAAWIPAGRAARSDPAAALRQQ